MKRFYIIILVLCMGVLISGCDSKNAYEDFKKYTESSYDKLWTENNETVGMNHKEKAYYYGMKLLKPAKPVCFVIGFFSFVLGWLLFFSFKKTPKAKRFAVKVLIVGLPLLCIIVVGGLASLVSLVE